jgi:hypothetical protein
MHQRRAGRPSALHVTSSTTTNSHYRQVQGVLTTRYSTMLMPGRCTCLISAQLLPFRTCCLDGQPPAHTGTQSTAAGDREGYVVFPWLVRLDAASQQHRHKPLTFAGSLPPVAAVHQCHAFSRKTAAQLCCTDTPSTAAGLQVALQHVQALSNRPPSSRHDGLLRS